MSDLPEETVQKIRQMRDEAVPWKRICFCFNVGYRKARSAVEPEYAKRLAEKEAERKWKAERGRFHYPEEQRPVPPEIVEKRRAWMHKEDTRDLTGYLFGDPVPHRSALYQKGGCDA